MTRSLALVTGSTQGIGLTVVKDLAIKHNYHVLLGVRNAQAGEKIASDLRKDGHEASVVELDLTSNESIEKAVKHIDQKYGYLDVLINNAGVLLDLKKDLSIWERYFQTFTTNVVGPGVLTEKLVPLLRKAKIGPPRIVFVTTVMGSMEKATDESTIYYNINYKSYDASKAAVNMLMFNFGRELNDVGGKVNAVCPGLVKTYLSDFHEWGTDTGTGAERIVEVATDVRKDGPTKTISDRNGPLPRIKKVFAKLLMFTLPVKGLNPTPQEFSLNSEPLILLTNNFCVFFLRSQPSTLYGVTFCSRLSALRQGLYARRNGVASSNELVHGVDSWTKDYEQTFDSLTWSEPSGVSFELDAFATDYISPINTLSTDSSVLTPSTAEFFQFPGITNDAQIHMRPRSLSAKGDLTQVSRRLTHLNHASRVIMQMLYAYPQMMLRRQTFPPFIHPHWHEPRLPGTLANCMSIAQLFAARTPETEPFLWRMIAAEEERFRNELLGSRFLDLVGSYSKPEQEEPSPTWEDWIFAESRRRMSCLWLIISCVITIENGRSCAGCGAMQNLPMPSSKMLWEARNLEEWQTEKTFSDMAIPVVTLGELVEAKANSSNPLHAQKLEAWEMGSDKMATMLDVAVEFVWGRVL
ncbi:hypothetical protein FSARC_4030 [Fusarium sarcochroum]|uniref:Short-chain dehydrogenase n=1 Tax=Fusarium sarcochroum TaxID=1208366 RepID=A0A8H4U2J0_9HYPO|nr:hypothetical protein FSARC_4030 [Fusarium sarcochroum]